MIGCRSTLEKTRWGNGPAAAQAARSLQRD
jgi:hypothetical protein